MKKMIVALLLAGTVLSLASCGRNRGDTLSSTNSDKAQNTTQSTSGTDVEVPADALPAESLLHSVYHTFLGKMLRVYGAESIEGVKGYFAGPETETVTEKDEDTGEEYSYELPKNEPGAISPSDGETLESMTLFPASSADQIGSAAVFFNMMNQNNGTFAAIEFKDGADMQTLADMMRSRIRDNQWICGFPEHFVIMNVGDILIVSYGLESSQKAWRSAVSAVYENASVLYDEAL